MDTQIQGAGKWRLVELRLFLFFLLLHLSLTLFFLFLLNLARDVNLGFYDSGEKPFGFAKAV